MNVLAPLAQVEAPAANDTKPGVSPLPSWICDFVVNGRFLSQQVTGVQRYAREVTSALDELLCLSNGRCQILAPRSATVFPGYRSIDVDQFGISSWHLWEQSELPLRAEKPILSLCNTGPAFAPEQIVCIHDANVFREPDSYSSVFGTAYRALLPMLARRAARIVTVSEASREELSRFLPIKSHDIVVIPNGHEHAFRWRAERSCLAQTLTHERPFVFLLASRARHKNVGIIVRQAEALDALGIDLVIAGGTAGIYASMTEVRRPSSRWLGRVSDDDLAYLYSHAMCLAFPSRSEGFGLPLVEAMGLGCPVVCSDRGSMLEICGDAALLASPDDPAAWFAHFASLAQSQSLRMEMRERGFLRAKRYSWTESARAYLDLNGRRA
jgi:glycosyltransferase involved in cell wall biosynthesis